MCDSVFGTRDLCFWPRNDTEPLETEACLAWQVISDYKSRVYSRNNQTKKRNFPPPGKKSIFQAFTTEKRICCVLICNPMGFLFCLRYFAWQAWFWNGLCNYPIWFVEVIPLFFGWIACVCIGNPISRFYRKVAKVSSNRGSGRRQSAMAGRWMTTIGFDFFSVGVRGLFAPVEKITLRRCSNKKIGSE